MGTDVVHRVVGAADVRDGDLLATCLEFGQPWWCDGADLPYGHRHGGGTRLDSLRGPGPEAGLEQILQAAQLAHVIPLRLALAYSAPNS